MSLWRRLYQIKKQTSSRKIFALVILIFILYTLKTSIMAEKTSSSLTTVGSQFHLDGNPLQILCGAIHYFRVTPDSWDDRVKKAKAMGINSIDM